VLGAAQDRCLWWLLTISLERLLPIYDGKKDEGKPKNDESNEAVSDCESEHVRIRLICNLFSLKDQSSSEFTQFNHQNKKKKVVEGK
jgi:hypothetical protein